MGAIADAFANAFRDFNTDGAPSSGAYKPVKSVIRALGPVLESAANQTFLQSGAGAVAGSLQAKIRQRIDLRDYAALTPGVDITAALQAACNEAFARKLPGTGLTTVEIPPGTWNLSATIVVRHGVLVRGAGMLSTYLRRTGDYGHTFQIGLPGSSGDVGCLGGGLTGCWVYHDHGAGQFLQQDPDAFINPVTQPWAHVMGYTMTNCIISENRFFGLPYQIYTYGAVDCDFEHNWALGIWDPEETILQEALATIVQDYDPALTPQTPRHNRYRANYLTGAVATGRTITWPGSHTTTDLVASLGPQRVFWLKAGEATWITDNYIAYGQVGGLVVEPTSGVINNNIVGNFFDSTGGYQLVIDGAGANFCNKTLISANQFAGQGNTLGAILVAVNETGTVSALKTTITGNDFSAFVGGPIRLDGALGANLTGNSIDHWNTKGFYNSDVDLRCGIRVGDASDYVSIVGNLLGGNGAYSGAGGCVTGVYAVDPIGSHVLFDNNDGLVSGDMFAGTYARVTQPIGAAGSGATSIVEGSQANEDYVRVAKGAGRHVEYSDTTLLSTSGLTGVKFYKPLTVAPGASVTPSANGDVTFQLTSNTQLTFKAKGSDGVVRSGSITLA